MISRALASCLCPLWDSNPQPTTYGSIISIIPGWPHWLILIYPFIRIIAGAVGSIPFNMILLAR